MSYERKPDEPKPLRDAIADVGRELGLPDPEHLGVVDALWDEVAGPALAPHTTVRVVRDGTCVVAVDTPHWATQSRYLEAAFVERAASVLGAGVVRRLQVVVQGPERTA
jgi:predicted nucleic acid-binding Zn ribbon protein